MEDRPFPLLLRFSGAGSPRPPLLDPFLLGIPHSHCISTTQGTPPPALQYCRHSIYSRGMTSLPTGGKLAVSPRLDKIYSFYSSAKGLIFKVVLGVRRAWVHSTSAFEKQA